MERFLRHVADIDAVYGHSAAGGIIEAGDEVEQGGFAAAGGADDGGGLARLGGEADVLQRVAVGAGETEAHVLELDDALPALAL